MVVLRREDMGSEGQEMRGTFCAGPLGTVVYAVGRDGGFRPGGLDRVTDVLHGRRLATLSFAPAAGPASADGETGRLGVNCAAMRLLRCKKRLEAVPAAARLLEEPGVIEAVVHLAGAWFVDQFRDGRAQ